MDQAHLKSDHERMAGWGVLSYSPTIDGLRGIAILLVLWYHASFLFRELPEFSGDHTSWSMLGVFGRMSLGGWIGVDLFFVVSGFLITTILLRSRETGTLPWVFWGRRGLRILPLAVIYLLTLVAMSSTGDPLNLLPDFHGWSWYAMYLGNIHITMYGWQPLAVMILWSLAIEEQFYLAWPWIVHVVSARQLKWCSIGLILLAPPVRAACLFTLDYPATYVFTLCRIDTLAAGALMAVLLSSSEWRRNTLVVCERLAIPAQALIVLTLLVPFSPSSPELRPWYFSVFGYSWVAASFAICLAVSLNETKLWYRILTSSFLTFVGKRCYGLYIWHVLVASMVTAVLRPFQIGFYGHALLWLIALLVVASASWALLEEPILRLKSWIPYKKKLNGKLEFTLAAVRR